MKKTIIFDCRSPQWSKDEIVNMGMLGFHCTHLNDQLWANGYLLLRDVYEALGIQLTKESLIAGWVRDTAPVLKFKVSPRPNGEIEVVLPEMESDIRYAFPSEEES